VGCWNGCVGIRIPRHRPPRRLISGLIIISLALKQEEKCDRGEKSNVPSRREIRVCRIMVYRERIMMPVVKGSTDAIARSFGTVQLVL